MLKKLVLKIIHKNIKFIMDEIEEQKKEEESKLRHEKYKEYFNKILSYSMVENPFPTKFLIDRRNTAHNYFVSESINIARKSNLERATLERDVAPNFTHYHLIGVESLIEEVIAEFEFYLAKTKWEILKRENKK